MRRAGCFCTLDQTASTLAEGHRITTAANRAPTCATRGVRKLTQQQPLLENAIHYQQSLPGNASSGTTGCGAAREP